MNTAPKLTVMSDTRFMPAAVTPAIEVLSAEKIYSNGTRALLPVNLTINQGSLLPCSARPAAVKHPAEDGRRPGGAQRRQADAVAARQSGKGPASAVVRLP